MCQWTMVKPREEPVKYMMLVNDQVYGGTYKVCQWTMIKSREEPKKCVNGQSSSLGRNLSSVSMGNDQV